MGVAQEHCEQILDNVDILRQSILGGTSGINHYQDSMYNAYGNRPSNIGPMHHNSPAVPVATILDHSLRMYLINKCHRH
uniref:Uncharacterized protein n=1 Tax=Magallana gigas TaxID=29159 RepID=K1PP06_MAGGI